jgi:hypothetical protein
MSLFIVGPLNGRDAFEAEPAQCGFQQSSAEMLLLPGVARSTIV